MKDLIIPIEFTNNQLLNTLKDSFEFQIRMRGEQYYRFGNVKKIIKDKNSSTFIGTVEGNDKYTTIINLSDEESAQFSCTCPYYNNCKHEWAMILAIVSGEFKEIELKPVEDKQNIPFEKLLKKIPAKKLKDYLIEICITDNIYIDRKEIEKKFLKCLPHQKYEFYYNSLYNKILLDEDYEYTISDFLKSAKEYINILEYDVCFEILKAVIEISHDFSIDITNEIPNIGMYLRICYKKLENNAKIRNYISKLEKSNYYDNVFIEDICSLLR